MTKKNLAMLMEWLRPTGIGLAIFFGYYFGRNPLERFHLMGPFVVIIMSGTVAFESLFFGEAASEKIGYAPNRAYQIQSGLANAAMTVTALLVYVLDWGRFIVVVMRLFFVFSAGNHIATCIRGGNMKTINLMRPVMVLLLVGMLLPHLISAVKR